MQYSSDSGCKAYWMLHSPTIPKCRTTRNAADLSMWYSSLDSVCDGAMTIESPVCTPNGSKFSMLQTVMQLSSWSRTTSYSTSFQPSIDFSMSNWGETAKAFVASVLNSSASWQMPLPKPPRANATRAIKGYPTFSPAAKASSTVFVAILFAQGSPISKHLFLKISLSSVAITVSIDVPSTLQLCLASTPLSSNSIPQFKAVWPPILIKIASGFSFSRTAST